MAKYVIAFVCLCLASYCIAESVEDVSSNELPTVKLPFGLKAPQLPSANLLQQANQRSATGGISLIPNPLAEVRHYAQIAAKLLNLIQRALRGDVKLDEYLDLALAIQGGRNAPNMAELRGLYGDLIQIRSPNDATKIMGNRNHQATVQKLVVMVGRTAIMT